MDAFQYLIPATPQEYRELGLRAVEEGHTLKLSATCSLVEGSHYSGPRFMTTYEIDDYPLLRVERTNPGRRIEHDATDTVRYWINADHAWKVRHMSGGGAA